MLESFLTVYQCKWLSKGEINTILDTIVYSRDSRKQYICPLDFLQSHSKLTLNSLSEEEMPVPCVIP